MAEEIHPKPTSLCSHHSTALYPFGSSRELPEGFAPWGIGKHKQVAPVWRDKDETPNSLLSCLKPCRLLDDSIEDISLTDRAGKPYFPKKMAINSLSRRSQEFFLTG